MVWIIQAGRYLLKPISYMLKNPRFLCILLVKMSLKISDRIIFLAVLVFIIMVLYFRALANFLKGSFFAALGILLSGLYLLFLFASNFYLKRKELMLALKQKTE